MAWNYKRYNNTLLLLRCGMFEGEWTLDYVENKIKFYL